MDVKRLILSFIALLPLPAMAVEPLPESSRIPATVVRTLSVENPTFHMPTDIAVDSTGTMYVADGARDRIVTLTPAGKLKSATTRPAGLPLNRPVGLSVDAKDRLWIADTANHRIIILGADEKLVETIPLQAVDAEHSADPTGLAITADLKRTYIVDNPNHRLLVRDNATGQIAVMGKLGQAAGQFQYPFMVAMGRDGDAYITEAIGARVQILNSKDKWAGAIGSWGVELGQLYRPKGVAVDSSGRIFVSDSTLCVVQAFDTRGRVIGCLTDAAGRPLHFEHPMGMTFDKAGNLYVVELAANRIAVVSLKGNPAGK